MIMMRGSVKAASKKRWPLFIIALLFLLMGCAPRPTARPAAPPTESTPRERMIYSIAVSEERAEAMVTIHANQPLRYTAVKHRFPPAVVLYFVDTGLKGVQESYAPENTVIKAIQTTEMKAKRRSSRIELRLTRDVPYRVTQTKNRVLVHFKKPIVEPGTPKEPKKEIVVPQSVPPEAQIEARHEPAVAAPAPAGESKRPAWVNRIDFEMLGDGKSRVIVGATDRVRYETARPSDKRLLLKLFNTRIPRSQRRPLITTRFKSAVDRILPIQTPKMGDMAVIAIELREPVPYRVHQEENLCVVEFEASTLPPKPMPEAEQAGWVQAMKEAEVEAVREAEAPPEEPIITEAGKKYTGERVSIEFQDAEIHNIFRILHEVSGKNFVIGDDVKGRVTLKLVNVPWDQVLDLVLKMNRLDTIVEGNIVRIATIKTLEAENKALQAKLKAERAAREQEPLVTEYIPVNYAGASAIKTHLDEIRTDRGKLTIDERTNMIIMNDIQQAIDIAREVVKRLDVVTPQVMIEARVVEAETSFSRQMGIEWGATGGIQSTDPDAGIGPQRGYHTLGGTYGYNTAVNLPIAGAGSIGFNFRRLSGTRFSLDATLMAMETQGAGKIISAPKVLTLDNKEAAINQGEEIPYKTVSDEGTKTEFKKVQLELKVTPHVTPDNRISMEVFVSKNYTGKMTQDGLAINTNEAQTELLVNDGDTIVIGGILETTKRYDEEQIPWLSKLPLLGWLFKSEIKTTKKRELLIFITPTIVRLEEPPLMG
jgi:type IV pilus assembly protein PilQ